MPAHNMPRSGISDRRTVRIEPWGEGDLPLLEALLGDPAMTEHIGGPESHEQLIERQARYERQVQWYAHALSQLTGLPAKGKTCEA